MATSADLSVYATSRFRGFSTPRSGERPRPKACSPGEVALDTSPSKPAKVALPKTQKNSIEPGRSMGRVETLLASDVRDAMRGGAERWGEEGRLRPTGRDEDEDGSSCLTTKDHVDGLVGAPPSNGLGVKNISIWLGGIH